MKDRWVPMSCLKISFRLASIVVFCIVLSIGSIAQESTPPDQIEKSTSRSLGPRPGDVYREFALHTGGAKGWRVTDPNAIAEGASEFLPNPIHEIEIDHLEGAVRAELLLDRWGGHPATTQKRIRFNQNAWLRLPELQTTKAGHPEDYYFQDNPVIEIPLDHLHDGTNLLEATCKAREGHRWGQFGMYSAIIRLYYDPSEFAHSKSEITSPRPGDTVSENPKITLRCSAETARVDIIAWYDGVDEDGDGIYEGWHESHFQPYKGADAEIQNHVGTVWRSPFELTWDTRFVPDQKPRSIKLIARTQDSRGVWAVSDVVGEISLKRQNDRVLLFKSNDVHERFGVRVGQTKSCTIELPIEVFSAPIEEVFMPLRTWHGHDASHHPLQLNKSRFAIQGKNHHYDFDYLPIDPQILKPGTNTFTIKSDTVHHMIEILWPGPALLVRQSLR